MSVYTNHPLLPGQAHIRLLQMRSGSSSDEIHCTISTFGINTAPSYHALSYEWGPKSPLQTIHVMGQPTKIRSNLFNFLSRLKARASYDYLWCDSICIDQTNDHERSHQVQFMNRIYRKAQSVLVWLGEARDNSDFTLRTIRLISTCTDRESRAAYLGDRPTVWQGLVDLSRRRYWTRIWIVQEIIVARDAELFCGSEVISWSTFAAATTLYHTAEWSQDLWTPTPLAGHQVVYCATNELYWSTLNGLIRSQRHWPNDKESFEALYRRYRNSGCEDGRDRIFALLGISTEVTWERGFIAEYHKSNEETFFSLVAWAGKGAVKMDSRLQFARMAAEALELTWPHYQLESSLESEPQRSPSFFEWARQPLEISLPCRDLEKGSFYREPETKGATIFRSYSTGAEVYLSLNVAEHDTQRDLYTFKFETSKVLLVCQVSGEDSWTIVGRACDCYAERKTRCRHVVPSVFQGLKISRYGAGGLGVQLQNVAQFMEIFLEKPEPTLHGLSSPNRFGWRREGGQLLRRDREPDRELEELLGKRRIESAPILGWLEGGRGSATMMDNESLEADLDKLRAPWDYLASSRIPSTFVEGPTPPPIVVKGPRKPYAAPSLCSPPDISLFSLQSGIGHSLDAPPQNRALDWRHGDCLRHGIR